MASERRFVDNQLVPEESRRLILDLLRERRSISIGAVERQFGVWSMTARRDLAILARQSRAGRIHGGVALGACVVVTEIDGDGAPTVGAEIGGVGVAVDTDVTEEASAVESFRAAALASGGVDVVVSNAGIASSAAISDTSVELRDRNADTLACGYFQVAARRGAS